MPAPVSSPFDPSSRRVAVYGYLAPLLTGRRVIEVGAGNGSGTVRLKTLGASQVLGVDADARVVADTRSRTRVAGVDFRPLERRLFEAAAGSFDLVVVPEGATVLQAGSSVTPANLARLCGRNGQVVMLVESSDRAGGAGVGYYEIVEALEGLFPRVRMFGLTPFAAFGIAEFAETPAGLRIDGSLVEDAGEQPTHYLVIAGPESDVDLGYALVQIPAEAGDAPSPTAAARVTATASPDEVELRRRLAEAEGKTEGLLRVSRAQTEEIEELRARLRRGAESREELDQEVGRLRRALTEADASVLDITRRTTQEMASLAQRITSGLRTDLGDRGEAGEGQLARAREELRRREEELAAAESALSERDDRVAQLEAQRQDLEWRLASAEAAEVPTSAPSAAVRAVDDGAAQRQRELALEQYRQAAAAHLDEVGRLREALAEQSTLVAELEDAVSVSGRRLASALEETERMRRQVAEAEESDRSRRSRLAEVEGTLLRLQRQTAMAATARSESPPVNGTPSAADWERRLLAAQEEARHEARRQAEARIAAAEQRAFTLAADLDRARAELATADDHRNDAERRFADAALRASGLEREIAERGAAPVTSFSGDRDARLVEAQQEIARLREGLERSEEQLWETKGQLLLDRERMAVLENELASAPSEPTVTEAAHQSIMNAIYKELAALETGVRVEIARIERIEKVVESLPGEPAIAAALGVGPRSTPIE